MRQHRQVEERIALRADLFGHLLQVDEIEAQAPVRADERDDVAPERGEALSPDALRTVGGEQRRGLRVERVDAERNLIYIRGSVAGPTNGIVLVRKQG